MKQRIYKSLCLIALVSLLCSTIASLFLYMGFHNQDKQEDLQSHCQDLAVAATKIEELGGDILYFFQNAADQSMRITVIQLDGTVLWDSQADAASMGNHRKRPEIATALTGVMGQDIRRSNTIEQDTYYCALQFGENDLILRLGRNQTNLFSTFQQILPLEIITCLVLFLVCAFLADQETERIVQPMIQAARHSESLNPNDFYEELLPFLETIRQQNDTIRAQLESIRQDKDTITFVFRNMKEGLIMISKEKRILSVNQAAMKMLDCFVEKPEGQSFLALTSVGSLIQAIEQALNGQNCSDFLPPNENGRIYQYFANPVYKSSTEQELTGMILFLLDVTEQQRAQKSREEFSANVSHELKTPLTSISGFAELMENGMVSSAEDIQMFSGLIRKESSRLLSLIDDIIRLSRIEADSEAMKEPVDLLDLALEERKHLLPAAAQKNVSIVCQGEAAVIHGNRTLLQEAVYNLCENAVKYNKQDGNVTISISENDDTVTLTVKDSGIGISREHHDRIFERFYRVDKSRSKETGGTGLGLSIVKHVVQVHHGQLHIESEVGKGCTISATFPRFSETNQSKFWELN